jgi:hypothetical protein
MRAMRTGAALFSFLVICPVLASAQEMAPVALNSLSGVPHAIAGAQVMDQRGHLLGKVSRVQTDQDGRPAALAFTPVNSKKVVVIAAAAASYDGKTVVADDQQPQIAALSATRVASE